MKKKTLLLTTLAGTMIVAGMTATGVKAAVEAQNTAVIKESESTAYVQLADVDVAVTRAQLKELVNARYENAKSSATVSKIAGEEVTAENGTKAVGTGTKVVLSNDKELTLVVYGDATGDGVADVRDVSAILSAKVTEDSAKKAVNLVKQADGDVTDPRNATRLLNYYGGKEGEELVDEDIVVEEKDEDIKAEVKTVNFIDTKFKNGTKTAKTNENGKIDSATIPTWTDSTGKYRLLGWSTKAGATVEENLEALELTKDVTDLYTVWVEDIKAIVNVHYDGETMKNTENKDVPKVEIIDTYKAGDTIDFSTLAPSQYKSKNPGIKFTQNGWYAVVTIGEKITRTEGLNSFQIPVPVETETTTTTSEKKVVTVDLYPSWDIETVSVSAMTTNSLETLMDDLAELQKNSDENYCANIEINNEVTLDNPLDIPEGVTLTFNKNVTVQDGASLPDIDYNKDGSIKEQQVIKGNGIKIIKEVGNKADSEVETDKESNLNASLNNSLYDVVKLSSGVTLTNTELNIEKGKTATLDVDGNTLSMEKLGVNNGNLTIKNSGEDDNIVITAKKGFENNGILTIGEETITNADGSKTVPKTVKITNDGGDSSTIVNKKDGTLTLKAGTIENKLSASSETNVATVSNEEGATLNVEGGTISVTTQANKVPAILNEGSAKITGGTISRNDAAKTQAYYTVVNHGTLDITNGEFTCTNGTYSSLIENGYYFDYDGLNKEEAVLTISGGSFTGGRYVIKNDYAGKATITAGVFSANADSDLENDHNYTKSIFKSIGEMEIDFSKATLKDGDKGDTKINLGNSDTKTNLVLIGDQKKTVEESKRDGVAKNYVKVEPFNSKLIQINNESIKDADINKLIVIETAKDAEDNEKVKSNIEICVGGDGIDAKTAGKQLIALMKNYVAMEGTNADRNDLKITLNGDVEIEKGLDTGTGYSVSSEKTTLDLNGKTLKIHSLYTFSNNINVTDSKGTGKIKLSNVDTGREVDLFVNGSMLADEKLAEIAEEERVYYKDMTPQN